MSLFERIQNKRYDLQESGPNDPKFFTGKTEDKFQGSKEGKKLKNIKKKSSTSLRSGFDTVELENPEDKTKSKKLKKEVIKRVNSAKKSGKIDDFTNKPIEGAPDTKQLIRGKKGETIANPIKPTKKTISKTSGTTQIKGVKDTELKPKTTGDEGQFRRNARRRKITGDVLPKKDLPKPTKTVGVNQADVSQKAQEFTKKINKKRVKKLPPIDLKKSTERVDLRTIKKNVSRKRPSNAPSLSDINKNIDAKNPVEMGQTGPKPVKGTVLKVDKGQFKRVKKIAPEGQKNLTKQVSADELLGNKKKIDKKIVDNTENTTKPSLWSRAKKKLKDIHNWMKSDYRSTSGSGKYRNITKNTYKNTLRGNTIRNINKVLPGKYKVLAAIATGAYLYSRGNKKDAGAAGAGGGPKKYYGANPKLKLDMKGSPPPPKAKESKK